MQAKPKPINRRHYSTNPIIMKTIYQILVTGVLCIATASGLLAQHRRMDANWSMARGNSVWSTDKRYELAMQEDGNLVLYRHTNGVDKAVWSSGTNGKAVKHCIFQSDGNLVLYDFANRPIWATGPRNSLSPYMLLQNDGNLVIYNARGGVVWRSGTDEKN